MKKEFSFLGKLSLQFCLWKIMDSNHLVMSITKWLINSSAIESQRLFIEQYSQNWLVYGLAPLFFYLLFHSPVVVYCMLCWERKWFFLYTGCALIHHTANNVNTCLPVAKHELDTHTRTSLHTASSSKKKHVGKASVFVDIIRPHYWFRPWITRLARLDNNRNKLLWGQL